MLEAEDTPVETNPFAAKEPVSGVRRRIPDSIGKELYEAVEAITPDTYAYKPMAKGGEHLVFEIDDPKHKSVVYKINFLKSKPLLRAHLRAKDAHIANEIERHKAIEEMEEEIRERNSQLRELREYFGAGAVPAERLMVREVPVSREVINRLDPNVLPAHVEPPEKLPAWVMIQRRLDLKPGRAVSLHVGQPEALGVMAPAEGETMDDVHEIYDVAHNVLVGNPVEGLDPEEAKDYVLELYPHLKAVAEKVDDDPAFKEKLQEIVGQLIKYTNETTTVLDFIGSGNILLVKRKDGWDLKLPDPLLAKECTMYDLAIAAAKLKHSEPLTGLQNWEALLALNALRAINALAMISGSDKRLQAPGVVSQIDPAVWREQLERQYQRAV
jgi:hypothetical protein